jgi:hypothetical protein
MILLSRRPAGKFGRQKFSNSGIVSKRLVSLYRSGRADCWVKVKNPPRRP